MSIITLLLQRIWHQLIILYNMFSNLLAELDSTIKEANKSMKKVAASLPASAVFDAPTV